MYYTSRNKLVSYYDYGGNSLLIWRQTVYSATLQFYA